MALSYVEYIGDGVNPDFNVTVPYLLAAHITVEVDGVSATFTWLTASQVRMDVAPANATTVRVLRTTPSTPLTDFVDGATLFDDQLDTAFLQALYVAEEARDAVEEVNAGDVATVLAAQVAAEAARDLAQQWSSEAEDVVVSGGQYSALHWAAKAAASAIAAGTWDPGNYRTSADQDVIDAAQDATVAALDATVVALDAAKYESSDLASQALAEAGVDNATLMTPLRTKQAIDALASGGIHDYVNQQAFTATGTWTRPSAAADYASFAMIEIVGAGGGGGEAQAGGSTAQGGEGADYALFVVPWDQMRWQDEAVTIGAGGAGAAASSGDGGGAGGTTTFGDIGGAGGGAGGDGSTGSGAASTPWSQSAFYAVPWSKWFEDGALRSAANTDGNDSIYGGASGAGSQNSGGAANTGGAWEYFFGEDGGSFDYTTGPEDGGIGCGGAAGRAGQGGGAGGDGHVLVTLY